MSFRLALLAVLLPTAVLAQAADPALAATARGIRDRGITLDSHDDVDPGDFTPSRNCTQRLGTRVNLPKRVDEQIGKLWSGTLLRVMDDGQTVAHAIRAGRM